MPNRRTQTLLFALLAAPLLHAQQDVHAPLAPIATRQTAPVFHLPNAAGKSLSLRDFRGKVVLVNFWATECGGCVLELPTFVDLQREFPEHKYTALGISVDVPYDSLPSADAAWKLVAPFVAKHGMTYPIVMGDQATVDLFHITQFPDTYLIDKQGRVAATYVGIVSKDDVERNIKTLLAE